MPDGSSTVPTQVSEPVGLGDAPRRSRAESTRSSASWARERGNVTQMQDIGGVRAVLPSLRHLYVVRRRLLKSWAIVRERDYVAHPKDSGYRALHLVVKHKGYLIEAQLRTMGQDTWANVVEDAGRQLGVEFKFGAGTARARAFFAEIAELIARFDQRQDLARGAAGGFEQPAIMEGDRHAGRRA